MARSMRVLVIAEKDIAARRIAKILSEDGAKTTKAGSVNVYELKRTQDGKTDEITVVGLKGHIVEMDFPRAFNRWAIPKLKELVWAEPEKKVDQRAKPIADALKRYAKKAQRVVLATDFDREGELIGVEALDLVRKGNPEIEVKRARFSALTADEVLRAFDGLAEVDQNLADSAEARQVVDLAWGATLTRFVSLASGQIGRDFLSVGRVQSPTLALIVDKEKEIRAFVPTPYWEVNASLAGAGADFEAGHTEGRFTTQESAQTAADHARAASVAKVTSVEKSERRENPPPPFNTTSFLRSATALGLSASRAMSVAEDLYMSGWISYPRTDNTVYPESLNLGEILGKLSVAGAPWGAEARRIAEKGPLTPTKGKKTSTDHPPIHPTEYAKPTDLSSEQWKVYELVVRRFLATLSDSAVVEGLKVIFDIGGEPFSSNGRRLVVPGFRGVYSYGRGDDVILPAMDVGDNLNVNGIEVLAKETQPPKRLSQGKLIQEMENLGLGTKSTRAEIIAKLYDRDFVRSNPPEPTPTGFALVDTLERYADVIAKPVMTSKLETEMDEIAEGRRQIGGVVKDSREMLAEVLQYLESNREQIGGELRTAMREKDTVGSCPKCSHALIIRRSRKGKRFVGCSSWPACDQTYPLPQTGKIAARNETCPTCKAPVIAVLGRGRPWITCLTIGCKGVEELRAKVAAEPAPAAADATGAEATPSADAVDPEDLEA
ncbi:MAG: DNA topoisomerase I [Thermoplasmatota archaeon]